jgi:uncharacterized membrane protein
MTNKNPFGIEDDGKTAGMLSYFFVLGWSMAFFTFHKNDKTSLSSYHLRQTLLLYISYLTVRFGLPFIFSIAGLSTQLFSTLLFNIILNATFIIFWLIGLDAAFKGEARPIPFLGKQAQIVFAKI